MLLHIAQLPILNTPSRLWQALLQQTNLTIFSLSWGSGCSSSARRRSSRGPSWTPRRRWGCPCRRRPPWWSSPRSTPAAPRRCWHQPRRVKRFSYSVLKNIIASFQCLYQVTTWVVEGVTAAYLKRTETSLVPKWWMGALRQKVCKTSNTTYFVGLYFSPSWWGRRGAPPLRCGRRRRGRTSGRRLD